MVFQDLIMKKIYALVLVLIPSVLFSQTVFWTEDFGTGCNQGQLASAYSGTNGAWTMTVTGPEADDANAWFVSARDNGNAIGTCGSGCGTNRTMHISNSFATPLPVHPIDDYAIYAEGFDGFCGLIQCAATSKRMESPTINCTGRTDISVNFKYFEGGNAIDNATLWYSANNGGAWTQISDMPKTALCGADRGTWTAYTFALPASANNNATVKIGLQWVNNDDGDATDPSFAVDDITLSVPDVVTCCPGDFNCDGVINVLDMIIMVNQFGCAAGCTADLNNDGIIGAADLTIFNGLYSDICP